MNHRQSLSLARSFVVANLVLFASLAFAQDAATPKVAKEPATADKPDGADPAAKSVKPGINDRFLDPDLDVQEWIERFEVESREVYKARRQVMENLRLQAGDRVADIGAGTGFFTLLMTEAVGPNGWTYAVELSPRFAVHLGQMFRARGVPNVTTVVCDDQSVRLPPDSIDVAFICDVYHHFEYPKQTMTSLANALVKGGRVIVIDFERVPGVSRAWTLGHVRAGKETFIDEINEAGFELVAERKPDGFRENYFLEFRKK